MFFFFHEYNNRVNEGRLINNLYRILSLSSFEKTLSLFDIHLLNDFLKQSHFHLSNLILNIKLKLVMKKLHMWIVVLMLSSFFCRFYGKQRLLIISHVRTLTVQPKIYCEFRLITQNTDQHGGSKQ